MDPKSPRHDIEVSIGPHVKRPDWSVLRVTYSQHPEHGARVTAALVALLGPDPTPFSPPAQEPTDRAGSE
jgi:hypothetical protein